MKISLDQAITATGCVAFTEKGTESCTITPARGLHGLQKQKDVVSQILSWFNGLERQYPLDTITDVCMEEFIKYVPRDRIESMMKLERFSGYLWAQIENWAINQGRLITVSQSCKGNFSKSAASTIAKNRGFAAGSEHEADAYVQGLMMRYDK